MDEIQRVEQWLGTLDFSGWRFSGAAYPLWLKLRDEEPFEYMWEGVSRWIYDLEKDQPLSRGELEALDLLGEVASAKAL